MDGISVTLKECQFITDFCRNVPLPGEKLVMVGERNLVETAATKMVGYKCYAFAHIRLGIVESQ
jgi:hypothetical protein